MKPYAGEITCMDLKHLHPIPQTDSSKRTDISQAMRTFRKMPRAVMQLIKVIFITGGLLKDFIFYELYWALLQSFFGFFIIRVLLEQGDCKELAIFHCQARSFMFGCVLEKLSIAFTGNVRMQFVSCPKLKKLIWFGSFFCLLSKDIKKLLKRETTWNKRIQYSWFCGGRLSFHIDGMLNPNLYLSWDISKIDWREITDR